MTRPSDDGLVYLPDPRTDTQLEEAVRSLVRHWIRKRGRTATETADHVGIARSTMYARLDGKSGAFKAVELYRIADFLVVPLEQFFDHPVAPNPQGRSVFGLTEQQRAERDAAAVALHSVGGAVDVGALGIDGRIHRLASPQDANDTASAGLALGADGQGGSSAVEASGSTPTRERRAGQHPTVWLAVNGQEAWIDDLLVEPVRLLWEAGIKTDFCCQGNNPMLAPWPETDPGSRSGYMIVEQERAEEALDLLGWRGHVEDQGGAWYFGWAGDLPGVGRDATHEQREVWHQLSLLTRWVNESAEQDAAGEAVGALTAVLRRMGRGLKFSLSEDDSRDLATAEYFATPCSDR